MPTNLDALIRYHTIDKCLQRKNKTWKWEDLSQACYEAVNEIRPVAEKNKFSKRTIDNDIKILRSDILGYNAPIVCKNGIYSYADPNYSINNCSLNASELSAIKLAAIILSSYKGFDFSKLLDNVSSKLESKPIWKGIEKMEQFVQFEGIEIANGKEHLDTIMNAILEKQPLEILYKRFEDNNPKSHILHPYLLKEYRGRWYVVGKTEKRLTINTFALDRIIELRHSNNTYLKNDAIDINIFFKNTIGVGFTENKPEKIVLKLNALQANYVKSQAIHFTQEIISESESEIVLSLFLVINNELISMLLSFQDALEILEPIHLREKILFIATQILNKNK